MQKWWLIGAGVVGVGLALLLLGRPFDTGTDIGPMADVDIQLTDHGPGAQPGGLIRGGGLAVEPGIEPTAVVGGAAGLVRASTAMVRPGARLPDPSVQIQGANPMAQRAAARRDVPEARLAARTTAPWTQIRREIAKAAGDDPNASALIGSVQSMLDDLKHTQRRPQSVDFADIQEQQTKLMDEIKSSPYFNSEIGRMLTLVDERNADYATEVRTGERVDPTR